MVKWALVEKCTSSLSRCWELKDSSEIFFYCPGQYLSPHLWASSLRRPTELGTFQIMTLSCQNSSGTGYKMLSRHSCCSSSSTPAEPHHNTGRCSQIASPLPPEAHPLLVVWNWCFGFRCVWVGRWESHWCCSCCYWWLKHEHIHPRSLCSVLVNSKMKCHFFSSFSFFIFCQKSQVQHWYD